LPFGQAGATRPPDCVSRSGTANPAHPNNIMKEIKKIKKTSLANVTAIIYGLIGFFVSVGIAISAMANIVLQKDFSGSIIIVMLFNIGSGILIGLIFSIIIGCFGWIIGYIFAGIYNSFVRRVGGIKIELVEVESDSEKKTEERKEEIIEKKEDIEKKDEDFNN